MLTKHHLLITSLLLSAALAHSQNLPIVLEAEDAMVGSGFSVIEEGEETFITIFENGTAGNPQSEERVTSFDILLPDAQQYDLYIRCRVGSGAADDDSFFYGNGFGVKSISSDDEWVRVNNIHAIGYTVEDQVVDGAGAAGTGVWKWINVSEFTGDETPVVFSVTTPGSAMAFQIGGREDGLDIDKIAFARANYYYTVSNLDNIEEGSEDPGTGGSGDKPIADGKSKFLGNVYSNSQLPGFTDYWNQVTPENAGKWGSAEPSRDNFNWTALDAAYALAKDNGFPYRHHVLIWGNQQPSWIENLSASEQLEEIEEWFAAVAERYPDIDMVEVVNEPLHDPPNQSGEGGGNYMNALGGSGSTGWDWIITSFEMARQYFPDAILHINDYNIVNSAANTNEYIEIIELLIDRGLIDAIGVQAHAFSTTVSSSIIESNLNKLAALGLPLYITELDIDGIEDQAQLAAYQRIFPIFWEHPAVKGVTLWGYRPGMWRTEQGAFLIEEDGVTERPSLEWLRGYVENTVLSSLRNHAEAELDIYPNPVSNGVITINGLSDIRRIDIFDMNGRMLANFTDGTNQIDIDDLISPGVYILQVQTGQTIHSGKVVIQH